MKMHLGYADSVRYLRELAGAAHRFAAVSLFVLPSFPLLTVAKELLGGTAIAYGAQDGHWEDVGPYTGSVSPAMLAELGCSVMEIGHAERRRDFGEDDTMVGRKAAAAVRWSLVPVVCVGEQRESADAEQVVARQVDAVLAELSDAGGPIVVAYEPVWAIGAGRTAPTEHIARVLDSVRARIDGHDGPTKVLYGGSVIPEAVGSILSAGADGIFASRAALTLAKLEHLVAEAARGPG